MSAWLHAGSLVSGLRSGVFVEMSVFRISCAISRHAGLVTCKESKPLQWMCRCRQSFRRENMISAMGKGAWKDYTERNSTSAQQICCRKSDYSFASVFIHRCRDMFIPCRLWGLLLPLLYASLIFLGGPCSIGIHISLPLSIICLKPPCILQRDIPETAAFDSFASQSRAKVTVFLASTVSLEQDPHTLTLDGDAEGCAYICTSLWYTDMFIYIYVYMYKGTGGMRK